MIFGHRLGKVSASRYRRNCLAVYLRTLPPECMAWRTGVGRTTQLTTKRFYMSVDQDLKDKETVSGKVSAMGEAAMNRLNQVEEAAGEYYDKGVSKAKELEANLESYVREKPIQSLLIATAVSLGAGLLIGALLKR